MAQQNIENFWNMCEDQIKHYTTQLNEDMGPNGVIVEYKVVDKTPIGVIYALIMHLSWILSKQRRCTPYFYVRSSGSHYQS